MKKYLVALCLNILMLSNTVFADTEVQVTVYEASIERLLLNNDGSGILDVYYCDGKGCYDTSYVLKQSTEYEIESVAVSVKRAKQHQEQGILMHIDSNKNVVKIDFMQ